MKTQPAVSKKSVSKSGTSAKPKLAVPGNAVLVGPTPVIPPKGFEQSLAALQQGFKTFVPSGFTLQTVGGPLTQTAILTQLAQILSLYTILNTARAQATASISQAKTNFAAGLPAAHTLYKSVKASLVAFYGAGNPALEKFGLTVKTVAARSPIEKAVAAAKSRQTRAANGTMGSKQKATVALAQEVQSVAPTLVLKGTNAAPSTTK
jgi:hypothetical protein